MWVSTNWNIRVNKWLKYEGNYWKTKWQLKNVEMNYDRKSGVIFEILHAKLNVNWVHLLLSSYSDLIIN